MDHFNVEDGMCFGHDVFYYFNTKSNVWQFGLVLSIEIRTNTLNDVIVYTIYNVYCCVYCS